MTLDRRFNLFGYRFSFRTNVPRAAELLSELYSEYVDASGPSPEDIYQLWSPSGNGDSPEWRIEMPGLGAHAKPSLGDALSAVEAAITAGLTRYPHGLHVVHGGVVYGPQGDLLLSGNSGAGKTTLSLALAARGLRVGGDDMAVLDPVSGVFRPHRRCFHIHQSSAELLAGMGFQIPAERLRDQFVTPRDVGSENVEPAQLRFVFLLEPERLQTPRILTETQAQAASSLLMQTGRGNFSSLEGVKAIVRLIGQARCFRLWSGELAATADAVLDVIRIAHASQSVVNF